MDTERTIGYNFTLFQYSKTVHYSQAFVLHLTQTESITHQSNWVVGISVVRRLDS